MAAKAGEQHHRCTIPDWVVERLRAMHDAGIGCRRLAAHFDLNYRTVKRICAYSRRRKVRPNLEAIFDARDVQGPPRS